MGPAERPASSASSGEASAPAAPPRFRLLFLLVIPLVAVAAYGNSLDGEFVWDDRPLILEDHTVKSLRFLPEIFTHDFFSRHEAEVAYGYYRPVITLTYALDYALWGPEPFGFHLTNVLLHAGASLLLAWILLRLGLGGWTSLLAGLLFAVHPIHTENVAWISGRTDLVSFVLVLGAFLAHLFAEEGERAGRRRLPAVITKYALFTLALLAKEMAVVLLPWVFLTDLRRLPWRAAARRAWPLVAIIALYGIWRFVVIDVAAPEQPEKHDPVEMFLSILPTVFRYLWWMVAPVEQTAYVLHPYVTNFADVRLWASVLAAGAIILGLRRAFPAHRGACLLVLALFASFLPIVNVVRIAAPMDMGAVMAERFAYYPSAVFLTLVAVGLAMVGGRLRARATPASWLVPAIVVVLGGVLGGATVVRNRVWQDEPTLFEDMRVQAPESVLVWAALTRYHIREGDLDEAERCIEVLKGFGRTDYHWRSSQALLHVTRGEFEAAIPIQEEIVAESTEKNATARNNLAFLYQQTGRTRLAVALLEPLVERGYGYSDVHCNLALALGQEGRFDEARGHFRRALALEPDSIPIGTAWASFELAQQRFAEAEAILRDLLDFHDEDPTIYNNLAVVQRDAGLIGEALASFARAIEFNPDYVKARMSYGRLLEAEGRRAQALEQYREVIRLAPGSPYADEARARTR